MADYRTEKNRFQNDLLARVGDMSKDEYIMFKRLMDARRGGLRDDITDEVVRGNLLTGRTPTRGVMGPEGFALSGFKPATEKEVPTPFVTKLGEVRPGETGARLPGAAEREATAAKAFAEPGAKETRRDVFDKARAIERAISDQPSSWLDYQAQSRQAASKYGLTDLPDESGARRDEMINRLVFSLGADRVGGPSLRVDKRQEQEDLLRNLLGAELVEEGRQSRERRTQIEGAANVMGQQAAAAGERDAAEILAEGERDAAEFAVKAAEAEAGSGDMRGRAAVLQAQAKMMELMQKMGADRDTIERLVFGGESQAKQGGRQTGAEQEAERPRILRERPEEREAGLPGTFKKKMRVIGPDGTDYGVNTFNYLRDIKFLEDEGYTLEGIE